MHILLMDALKSAQMHYVDASLEILAPSLLRCYLWPLGLPGEGHHTGYCTGRMLACAVLVCHAAGFRWHNRTELKQSWLQNEWTRCGDVVADCLLYWPITRVMEAAVRTVERMTSFLLKATS